MTCDYQHAPKVFDRSQLKQCDGCKHASRQRVWCCLFGLWIRKQATIKVARRMPSLGKMAGSLARESVKYIKAGRPKRTEAEQTACRLICVQCEHYQEKSKLGPRCSKCGCCVNLKTRWATAHCPEGLW